MLKWDASGPSLNIDVADVEMVKTWLQSFRDKEYINYSPEHASEAYADSKLNFVQNRDGSGRAPYQVVFDYRSAASVHKWGRVTFGDRPFAFPGALEKHRTAMRLDFERRGLLKKDDQPAVRVAKVVMEGGEPHFYLQEARYFDQVGTNLSIDYLWDKPITVNQIECHSVREWDVAQSHGAQKRLPKFQESQMANTIGVAVGLSARASDGQTHWLRRKRHKKVAVYAGMWHLPFSFALCLEAGLHTATDLESLLKFDLAHELSEELSGLELGDFGELKPVAFCRDLARGGKPQFFLELPCLLTPEQVSKKTHSHGEFPEYTGNIKTMPDLASEHYSAELVCFSLLTKRMGETNRSPAVAQGSPGR